MSRSRSIANCSLLGGMNHTVFWRTFAALAIIGTSFWSTTGALASIQYTGSIVSSTDLVVGGGWTSASLDWLVKDNENGTWNYEYTFEYTPTSMGALSHITFELSLNVDSLDLITNILIEGGVLDKVELEQGGDAGNPGIPGDFTTAVKFEIEDDDDEIGFAKISFDIPRLPTWGDFYAKGGATRYAHNSGFIAGESDTVPSNDPTNPAANGPLIIGGLAHILVPDTIVPPGGGVGDVPEPMSIAVWSLLAGIAALISSRPRR